jgi:hypothetical protein
MADVTAAVYVSGSPPVAVASDALNFVEVLARATVMDVAWVLTAGGSSESAASMVNG